MRIGISCYSTFGGSGVVATEVGKALAARGHEVHILSPSLPPRLIGFEDRITFHEVRASPYPLFEDAPYSIALGSKMADVAEHNGLDIIHAHYAIPHAMAALLARMAVPHLKVVTTLHGTDITVVGSDPSYLPMVRMAIRESDGVTAVSEYLREETVKTFGVDRTIDVIGNLVEPPGQERPDCRAWLAPKAAFVLTHISNFRPVKRVMDVLRVFEQVRKEVPARLIMVGDGPDRVEAEAYCREQGFAAEAVDQSNFHDYPVLRLPEMPRVEVHTVTSSENPSGVGEPATPVIAPAVANALFAATGRRLRKLPFSINDIKA